MHKPVVWFVEAVGGVRGGLASRATGLEPEGPPSAMAAKGPLYLQEIFFHNSLFQTNSNSCLTTHFKSTLEKPHSKAMLFGLNSTAYSELYCIYQFMMTLAVTQVECERTAF